MLAVPTCSFSHAEDFENWNAEREEEVKCLLHDRRRGRAYCSRVCEAQPLSELREHQLVCDLEGAATSDCFSIFNI